ncbi:glycosyltransferase [filamentous cyanobacterium LEGE 11480]|uniref:Glycosyltransferase n=1 Tax=Romeriopsis navalis LEGE 11480 TaxID=2777977 RepID=A0A928Z319_9CYAN|nr:glycosyltransferase [Romeriopsis navalis]MBE9031021.1 glycosyltransferase [Romeriopsis navalis LEGE 11480]
MAKILILLGGHLCNGPRPCKEADALAAAGHDVMVAGVWFDPKFVQRDQQLLQGRAWQFQPVLDFRGITLGQKMQRLGVRLQAKIARALWLKYDIQSPALLGYGAKAMLKFAQGFQADLTIVHSEAGLWVGNCLQAEGYKVGVDFEDWFSEDLLPEAKASRPIAWIQSLESQLAKTCTYCLTPSQAMAAAIAAAYNCATPTVIYNAFPATPTTTASQASSDRQDLDLPSLHWFSQTIGPGRGLETVFAALPHLQSVVEIHLRGNCPAIYQDWIMSLVPAAWRDRVYLHGTVDNHILPLRIAEHDIGLALESPQILSRDLTVTNKLFQYLEAGLAVIATNTAGQQEVLQQSPQAGELIPASDPFRLADVINQWIADPEHLQRTKQAAKQAGIKLGWDTQAAKLTQQVELAIGAAQSTTPRPHSELI